MDTLTQKLYKAPFLAFEREKKLLALLDSLDQPGFHCFCAPSFLSNWVLHHHHQRQITQGFQLSGLYSVPLLLQPYPVKRLLSNYPISHLAVSLTLAAAVVPHRHPYVLRDALSPFSFSKHGKMLLHMLNNAVSIHFSDHLQVDLQLQSGLKVCYLACVKKPYVRCGMGTEISIRIMKV